MPVRRISKEERDTLGTDYYKNLSILLRADFTMREANSLASEVKKELEFREFKKFDAKIKKQLEDLGLYGDSADTEDV